MYKTIIMSVKQSELLKFNHIIYIFKSTLKRLIVERRGMVDKCN
jgi:hypothetical protein